MYYKKKNFFNKYVIGGLLILLILFILGITFVLLSSAKAPKTQKAKQVNKEQVLPEVELTKEGNEEGAENIKIKAVGSIEGEVGIKSIILPDGKEEYKSEAEYIANKNGEYKFGVYANNGKYAEKTIKVEKLKETSAKDPYIPEGFKHKEGTVEEGFVITDLYENEFVWIPVENGQLKTDHLGNENYEDKSNTVTRLQNSVAINKGYYVSRYEMAQAKLQTGEIIPLARPNLPVWVGVSYKVAKQSSEDMGKMLGYKGVSTGLMTSYGWVTMVDWISQKNSGIMSATDIGNHTGKVELTGKTKTDKLNNIFDLSGNVREWTTEIYKSSTSPQDENQSIVTYKILRGGSATIANTILKSTAQLEDDTDNSWGFRTILFKE